MFWWLHSTAVTHIGFRGQCVLLKVNRCSHIALAFSIVFITVETSIVSARVHAIIFLANRSITQLRYTKPSLLRYCDSHLARVLMPDAQVPGTLKLCEIRMLLAIINGIQFELLGMLFSWHNEYLLLVLYNIFRGISHFVLYYLYASTILVKKSKSCFFRKINIH